MRNAIFSHLVMALFSISLLVGSKSLATPPHRVICDDGMWEVSQLPRLLKTLAEKEADLPQTPESRKQKANYRVGRLDPKFEHDTKYTVDLENQSPVKDQCGLGTCHIYSLLSNLEQSYTQRTGKEIKLSSAYIVYTFWYMRALATLKKVDNDVLIEFAAELPQTVTMFRKTGLIPDGVWKPKKNFQESPLAERLVAAMTNSMARATENAQAEKDPAKRKAILQQEVGEILRMIHENVGDMPTDFVYNGRTYTPQSFAKKFFGEVYRPWVYVKVNPNPNGRSLTRIKNKFQTKTYRTSIDRAEDIIRARIDAGQNVSIGFQHLDAFVDDATGIMSLSAFSGPSEGRTLDRSLRAKYHIEITDGHAVQIVGYDVDPYTGRVKKWKMKNSWGKFSGDHGYYHMYADYFRAYLDDFVIPDDGFSVP